MPRKKPKDEKRIIPLHFATFGDMMMNMLTLFILLCSFAQDKNAEFFEAGRGSFIKAIESLGLPGVLPADDSAIQLEVHNDRHRFVAPVKAVYLGLAVGVMGPDSVQPEPAGRAGLVAHGSGDLGLGCLPGGWCV